MSLFEFSISSSDFDSAGYTGASNSLNVSNSGGNIGKDAWIRVYCKVKNSLDEEEIFYSNVYYIPHL